MNNNIDMQANGLGPRESRIDEMRSVLEFHDLPTVLLAAIKNMPEENFRRMMEELAAAGWSSAVFEEGGLPGRGALKILVGKGPEQELSPSECAKIGKIIASMKGEPRKYYVGMVNFLGAACRIHHEIKTSYMDAVRAGAEGNAPSEKVPDAVYRLFPGKKPPTKEEIKKREEEEIQRLKELNAKTGAQEKGSEKGPEKSEKAEKEEDKAAGAQPDVSAQVIRHFRKEAAPAEKPEETEPEGQAQEEKEKPQAQTAPGKEKAGQFKQYVQPLNVSAQLIRHFRK